MQPFRLRADAKAWFKDLRESSFKVDFDAFYFCFVAGITAKRKQSVPNPDTGELVAYFPDRYHSRGKLLVALFLTRELEQLGVDIREKTAVYSALARLVSPSATNYLTDEGVREFNRYAHGGFDVLLDWFDDDRPRSLDTFVRMFKDRLDFTIADTDRGQ